jgi:hypothetical protein
MRTSGREKVMISAILTFLLLCITLPIVFIILLSFIAELSEVEWLISGLGLFLKYTIGLFLVIMLHVLDLPFKLYRKVF